MRPADAGLKPSKCLGQQNHEWSETPNDAPTILVLGLKRRPSRLPPLTSHSQHRISLAFHANRRPRSTTGNAVSGPARHGVSHCTVPVEGLHCTMPSGRPGHPSTVLCPVEGMVSHGSCPGNTTTHFTPLSAQRQAPLYYAQWKAPLCPAAGPTVLSPVGGAAVPSGRRPLQSAPSGRLHCGRVCAP